MRAVLVPVKSFSQAKLRLAPVLDSSARHELARALAAIVLHAARELPRYVACDDDEVADWAVTHGAEVLWTPGLGLSGAIDAGVAHLSRVGFALVVVAHGDLPLALSFDHIGEEGEVTLVPDRHLDGTNVAVVPAAAGFRFAYGPGSFSRHRLEAERIGMPVRVVHDARLSFDIDVPADLTYASETLAKFEVETFIKKDRAKHAEAPVGSKH